MEFRKFSSIENTYRTKEINDIVEQGLNTGMWCVQEKVHGANFSFWYDGADLRVAKRTSFVDGNFFNCQVIVDKYGENVKALFDYMKGVNPNIETVHVFGELYGGSYPGLKSDTKAIQKGVFYFNELDFYAFDIRIASSTGKVDYLDVDEANRLFDKFDFFFAKHVFTGSFEDCLAYTNEYDSTIPALKGMPALETPNICEGNVIRPIKITRNRQGNRLILKNKNEKWSEKSHKSRTPKVPVAVPEHVQKYIVALSAYITENRLRNVLSKYGTVAQKDFGKLSGLLIKDALAEFMLDNPEFPTLPKDDKKIVTKQAGRMGADLIRPNFANILDGEF